MWKVERYISFGKYIPQKISANVKNYIRNANACDLARPDETTEKRSYTELENGLTLACIKDNELIYPTLLVSFPSLRHVKCEAEGVMVQSVCIGPG